MAVLPLVLALASDCKPAPSPPQTDTQQVLPTSCSPGALGLAKAFERIGGLLAERLQAEEIPGLAAGVVCGDRLVWAEGYGVFALDDLQPVTPKTRFRIASVTKVFTATAIMKLQEAGVLTLGDPVAKHLPWFRIGRPRPTGEAPVTILHLLTHTGGMPPNSRLTDFSRLFQPGRQEAIAALPSQQLLSSPGEKYLYSNLGYAVLGEVLAEAAGTSYAEYLAREIFAPLGMAETLVHPTPEDHTAWGHGPRRAIGPRPKAGFWELGFFTPAGGMASSVEDLSKFIVFQLSPYSGAEPRLLSSETLREMHRVQHTEDPARGGVGLGWAVETSDGQHVVYQGGELPEQTSYLLIDLSARIGIVFLSNAQDVDTEEITWEMLRMVRAAIHGPAPAPR